jgi:hypothetical protein
MDKCNSTVSPAQGSGRSDSRFLPEHNFFEPQPVTNAAVFILRHVLHDWAAPDARKILKRLAEASAPSTRVLLIDHILPYSCAASVVLPTDHIPGAERPPLPAPLLMSAGRETALNMDIIVGVLSTLRSPPAQFNYR